MNRLANASSRSTRLYDLRAEQDDDRCDVDPGKKPCRERERPVRREQGERSREVAERQLGDLPQHGRYQCALRRRSPRRPVARDDAVHDEEKDEAGEKARERREEPHARIPTRSASSGMSAKKIWYATAPARKGQSSAAKLTITARPRATARARMTPRSSESSCPRASPWPRTSRPASFRTCSRTWSRTSSRICSRSCPRGGCPSCTSRIP